CRRRKRDTCEAHERPPVDFSKSTTTEAREAMRPDPKWFVRRLRAEGGRSGCWEHRPSHRANAGAITVSLAERPDIHVVHIVHASALASGCCRGAVDRTALVARSATHPRGTLRALWLQLDRQPIGDLFGVWYGRRQATRIEST